MLRYIAFLSHFQLLDEVIASPTSRSAREAALEQLDQCLSGLVKA